MKKIYLSLIALAAMPLMACGGGNKSAEQTEAPAPSEKTVDAVASVEEKAEVQQGTASLTFEEFSAELKEACGMAPITTDRMKKLKFRKDGANEWILTSPVYDDIDGVGLQRQYYNSFAQVADGGRMYGFHMDQSRGEDVFKDYDSYIKFIDANGDYAKAYYGYDFKGKHVKVFCSVSFGDFGLTVTVD